MEELYNLSIKELLFELKYTREGKAYDYWKIGIAVRYGSNPSDFPSSPRKMSEELFEKQSSGKMPEWLKDDYEKMINERISRR